MGRNLVNGQRTLPHSIMVNSRGRRFTNEAANYNAFGAAFHVEDVSRFEYANLPCWLIFDQNYVDTYGFRIGAGSRGHGVPDWIVRADSPGELGDILGIDGDELEGLEVGRRRRQPPHVDQPFQQVPGHGPRLEAADGPPLRDQVVDALAILTHHGPPWAPRPSVAGALIMNTAVETSRNSPAIRYIHR